MSFFAFSLLLFYTRVYVFVCKTPFLTFLINCYLKD